MRSSIGIKIFARLGLFFLLVCSAQGASAAVFCVSNAQQLQQDLNIAVQNHVANVIQLVSSATPYTLDTANDIILADALSVLGGYAPGCASRVINPANTTIDFAGTSATFELNHPPASALLQFDGLTLQNGGELGFSAGDVNCCSADAPGYLRVSNTRITKFQSTNSDDSEHPFWGTEGPIVFNGTSSQFTLLNLQIDHITQAGSSTCAVTVSFQGDTVGELSYLTVDLGNGKAFCLKTADGWQENGNFQFDIYNSIFWASDKSASPLLGQTTGRPIHVNLVNDIFHSYIGDGDVTFTAPSAPALTDPLWIDPANGNYQLAASQPGSVNAAINSGAKTTPFGNPLRDIAGNARQIGSNPDRGAYESPYSSADLFTVSNTNDSGPGSLRTAIIQASSSQQSSSTIRFAILDPQHPQQGLCPAVINLNSPLPDITTPMLIDGYTQSPAQHSSDNSGVFDATLCVVVQPGNNQPYYGFRVPSAAANASLYRLRADRR